jgi:hypothetical protein
MSPDPRDEIAEALQYGRMKPEEAEARLKELGLPPLAPQPDPATFNPMREVWWSLPMTVAWIAWRNSADVRDAWDAYRREQSFWIFERWRVGFDGPVHEGYNLKPGEPATLSRLALTEIYRRREGTLPKEAISIKDAKASLWTALSLGALEATGKPIRSGPRIIIPEQEWRDLVDVERDGRDVVQQSRVGIDALSGYMDLAFKSKTVMSLWSQSRMDRRGMSLPETMRPEGPGHMPLYCAVQWIATKGGTVNFEPTYATTWERAYSELLARVSSNQVTVTGVRKGVRERLDGFLFASIAIDYPFFDSSIDLIFKDELHLQSYSYSDPESWRRGFDDSLRNRDGIQWSQLMVPKEEIARWWPFDAIPQASSGAPGRPTSIHLVKIEYDARWRRGEALERIGAEAEALAAWLADKHPESPQLTAKTIANNLGAEHRRRWHAARK